MAKYVFIQTYIIEEDHQLTFYTFLFSIFNNSVNFPKMFQITFNIENFINFLLLFDQDSRKHIWSITKRMYSFVVCLKSSF